MRRHVGIAALLLPLALACSVDEPTEIVAGVSTQMRVPEGIKSVGLFVVGDGQPLFCEHYPVLDGTATLPATLGVLQKGSGELVTVTVYGFRTEESGYATDCFLNSGAQPAQDDEAPNEVTVMRRRRLPFSTDRILFLPLPLKESCSDKHCEDDNQTCIGGECVAMDIDASTLPDYQDSLLFGTTSTCFDPDLCMPQAARLPVLLENPDDCTFRAQWSEDEPLPSDELNVRMVYSSLGSEILDLDSTELASDQQEGITLPDPEDPLRFRLAPNLCSSNYKKDKILALEASPLCPGKRAFQPLCETSLDSIDGAGGAGGGGNGGSGDQKPGICTLASLASVESAAYVLMDHSFSMYRFYGAGGLRFAVELPLSNPVARQTRMAFDLMPAEVLQCDAAPADNRFATPDIPFQDVSLVRTPIGERLGNQANVLPDNPPLFMEAAMEGAYQALADFMPSNVASFNRKALIVIANRGFADTCATDGVTPAQRALTAFTNQGIYTYSVVLDDEAADDLTTQTEVAEATAVATNGGTTVFNGVADEAEGAAAVQTILNELGSCLYEVRNPLTGESELPDPATATLSYINPLAPVRETIDIPYNDDCQEGDDVTASGWKQETGGLVRICGQACDDLREVLDTVSVFHALEEHVAPSVPLIVSGPCPDDGVFTD